MHVHNNCHRGIIVHVSKTNSLTGDCRVIPHFDARSFNRHRYYRGVPATLMLLGVLVCMSTILEYAVSFTASRINSTSIDSKGLLATRTVRRVQYVQQCSEAQSNAVQCSIVRHADTYVPERQDSEHYIPTLRTHTMTHHYDSSLLRHADTYPHYDSSL